VDESNVIALPGVDGPGQRDGTPIEGRSGGISLAFAHTPIAWHGQPVPGGGTLSPVAFVNPPTINRSGRMAFFSNIDGVLRNQGVFVADQNGLTPIAIGCGGGGGSGDPGTGCGDPTPIGGTFSGMFGGTVFAPPINDWGDVLFISDVYGGSSPRAMFLYQAAENDIIKIAAVGDPSPMGGIIGAVGPGSLNNRRQIVFLMRHPGSTDTQVFKWEGGTVTKYVAVGDPAPGGGTFRIIAGESLGFVDGTTIPIGAVPDINELGQISFFGIVQGGLAERGLFLSQAGVHQWYLSRNDPTPLGGSYVGFWGPIINDNAEMTAFADIHLGGGQYTSAWIVGKPGNWRKALAFYDQVDGGQVCGQAVSRNPFQVLDDCGSLVAWCNIRLPDSSERERLIIVSCGGAVDVVARQGEPTPLGGTFGTMQSWPSVNDLGQATLSTATPGAPGILNAHFRSAVGNRKGDADHDLDLDFYDFAEMGACLAGPAVCPRAFACRVFDFDDDADFDLADFADFQTAFMEEGR
jgi:hypothetical protein